MNRKQFLKSLLIIPATILFGKKIFAKDKTIEEQISEAAKDPNLTIISENKYEYEPNPYKLPFADSKDEYIKERGNIFICCHMVHNKPDEFDRVIDFYDRYFTLNPPFDKFFQKYIIPKVGNNFYYMVYRSFDENSKLYYNRCIVGDKLDWWLPITDISVKDISLACIRNKRVYSSDFVVDDTSTYLTVHYLTIQDKKTIKDFLNIKEMLKLHDKKFLSTDEFKRLFNSQK